MQPLRVLRQSLSPGVRGVSFERLGFPVHGDPQLQRVSVAVICGFEWAMLEDNQDDLEQRLELIDPEYHGFAYEGATMALTIADALSHKGGRTAQLLTGGGAPHLLLSYIGMGFAMAKIPRRRWHRVIPDIPRSAFHPTMSWLAVDGYGFDRAFFDPKTWINGQRPPSPYPWQRFPEYFARAFDQGVGRAIWFFEGGEPRRVSTAVNSFAPSRRADLWSGVGLAATFAPSTKLNPDELKDACGNYSDEVSLGATFAITARTEAGLLPARCASVARTLTGHSPEHLNEIARRTAPSGQTARVPAYETWRSAIRAELRATDPDNLASAMAQPPTSADAAFYRHPPAL